MGSGLHLGLGARGSGLRAPGTGLRAPDSRLRAPGSRHLVPGTGVPAQPCHPATFGLKVWFGFCWMVWDKHVTEVHRILFSLLPIDKVRWDQGPGQFLQGTKVVVKEMAIESSTQILLSFHLPHDLVWQPITLLG